METSRTIVKEAGLYPKLRIFQKKGNSTAPMGKLMVQLKKDKLIVKKDERGKDVEHIRYLVLHNDELKTYDTRKLNKETGEVSYLVQRLAEIKEDSWVELEGKKIGMKNYISVIIPDDGEVIDEEYPN